jgi:pentatricopeptide repeat protein
LWIFTVLYVFSVEGWKTNFRQFKSASLFTTLYTLNIHRLTKPAITVVTDAASSGEKIPRSVLTALIMNLWQERSCDSLLYVFDIMVAQGKITSRSDFRTAMTASIYCGQTDRIEQLFEMMQAANLNLGKLDHGNMLQAYVKSKRYDKAIAYFENLWKSAPQVIDTVLLNMYLSSLTQTRRTEEAYQQLLQFNRTTSVLHVGKKANARPVQYVFNTIMSGLLEAGAVVAAEELFQDLRNRGLDTYDISYTIFMLHGIRTNNTDYAVRFATLFMNKGIPPTRCEGGRLTDHAHLLRCAGKR